MDPPWTYKFEVRGEIKFSEENISTIQNIHTMKNNSLLILLYCLNYLKLHGTKQQIFTTSSRQLILKIRSTSHQKVFLTSLSLVHYCSRSEPLYDLKQPSFCSGLFLFCFNPFLSLSVASLILVWVCFFCGFFWWCCGGFLLLCFYSSLPY